MIGDALPYEAPYLVQRGEFIQADKARLAEGTTAATAWTDKKAVQVTLDGREASVFTGDTMLESVFTYVLPPGKPRLRVVKMASKHDARPGETVDFTIRFDNVGDQPLGNVTLMDNLSTRLEFVPDTAQCSVDAAFSSGDNEGESLVLRWEIADPLKVGEGGVIRFQCRVR